MGRESRLQVCLCVCEERERESRIGVGAGWGGRQGCGLQRPKKCSLNTHARAHAHAKIMPSSDDSKRISQCNTRHMGPLCVSNSCTDIDTCGYALLQYRYFTIQDCTRSISSIELCIARINVYHSLVERINKHRTYRHPTCEIRITESPPGRYADTGVVPRYFVIHITIRIITNIATHRRSVSK